jgi:tetratricopeptide (TPR) repeat protein
MTKYSFFLCCFFACLSAQAHSDHTSAGGMGIVSEAYLDSSIAVLTGIGTYDGLQITSSLTNDKKALALTYTKQGIALNHAFQWEDSVRSFQEALRLDPKMARAYTGLVVAYMSLANSSSSLDFISHDLKDAAQAASSLSNNEVDRLWVDVYSLYYSQYTADVPSPVSQLGQQVSGSMKQKIETLLTELMNTYHDPEAYAFYGWDLQHVEVLAKAGKLFPKHSGILHYLTHVNENSGHYEAAADYARQVIALAPDAPHLIHMYGHILPLLGQWDEANKYFLRAHCIHRAQLRLPDPLCAGIKVNAPMSAVTPKPTELWHYSHNLELFGFGLMRARDLKNAEIIFLDRCEAGDCTSIVQFYLGEGMYDKAIAKAKELIQNGNPATPTLAQMEIQALIAQKNIPAAQELLQQFPATKGLEALTTYLFISFANGSLSQAMAQNLTSFLDQATTDPNFDTWSHQLPILRKLYKAAVIFAAIEKQEIYDAIQKIDPGHPL